jgi:hypothetical protein
MRNREYPLSSTPRQREMKVFLERLRDGGLPDEAEAKRVAQLFCDSRKRHPHLVYAIDQFRMLLAIRRAEALLGSKITIPVKTKDIGHLSNLVDGQLIENLKTRDIENEDEYRLTGIFKRLLDTAAELERRPRSEEEDARLKVLKENHALLVRRREAWNDRKKREGRGN